MRRLLEALLYLMSPLRSPQLAVVDVACELQRLEHRLWQIMESLTLPRDLSTMKAYRTPKTVTAELYSMADLVRGELSEAAQTLLKTAQTTDEELREEFFSRVGGRV